MEKQIKIVSSPFNPCLEVVNDIAVSLYVPYSEQDVSVQISPNILEYKENDDKPGIQLRQIMVTTNTDETKILHLDFKDDNVQNIIINNKEYKVRLLSIGKENIQGQDFPSFEFYIKW